MRIFISSWIRGAVFIYALKKMTYGEYMVTCSCNALTFRTIVKGDKISQVFIRNPTETSDFIEYLSVDGIIRDTLLHVELKGKAMNRVDLLPYAISVTSTVTLTLSSGNTLIIQPEIS